jgi:hypothetical protein
MSIAHSSAEESPIPPEYIRMYYEHQYDRMAKLEEQGLTITNVVMGLSVVALTFGFNNTQGVNTVAIVGLPFVMTIANAFAVGYILRTSSWIRTYQQRAKGVLDCYAHELYEFDQPKAALKTWIPGRRKIQLALHSLLIVAAVGVLLYC